MKQMDGEMKKNMLGRCPKGKVQHHPSSHASALRTHLKTHRGEKSSKCNRCDYTFFGVFSLYLLGISPTHFASFPHPFASFPHQICFVSPKKCFISPTVCCISPTKCFISPTVCCISLCNVVSRCQKIFYQIFSVFFYIFGIKFCLKFSGDSGIKRGGGGVGVKPTITQKKNFLFLRCAFSYASSDHETLFRSSCIVCRQKVSRRCVKACDTSYYCSDCMNC